MGLKNVFMHQNSAAAAAATATHHDDSHHEMELVPSLSCFCSIPQFSMKRHGQFHIGHVTKHQEQWDSILKSDAPPRSLQIFSLYTVVAELM